MSSATARVFTAKLRSKTRRSGAPRRREAELWTVEAPRHGTLEFPRPDVALYTPGPGYTGPDTYTFAGRGPTKSGQPVKVRVTVRATVVNP